MFLYGLHTLNYISWSGKYCKDNVNKRQTPINYYLISTAAKIYITSVDL